MFKMLAATTIALIFFTASALAQSTCAPRDFVLGKLAKNYGETIIALGVTNKGGLIEVLTSSDGGTWTIILTTPQGTSCFVAAGEGWHTKDRDDSKLAPVI